MDPDILHSVERGLYRLLFGPRDIEGGTPVPPVSPPLEQADERLREVFALYCEGCGDLHDHCLRWWRGCIASAHDEGMSREEAIDEAYTRRAAGPASAPEFVWLIRHFWLMVDEVNQGLPFEQRAAPQDVLLKWLDEAGHQDYVVLATAMPYWPIGLDAGGKWC